MKVAIVGAAPSSRDLAPYNDQDWLIWTCAPSNRGAVPKCDAWFELHDLPFLQAERNRPWSEPYFAHLKGLKCPVYMQVPNSSVPNAVTFPADKITAEFGPVFLTSSIAWMLAFAILEGATEIAIYGVDMTASSEYEYERPGCQYYILEARKRGITVTIPPQSDLDAPLPLYGYGDKDELRARIAALDAEIAQLSAERGRRLETKAHLSGALEENVMIRRTWFAWSGEDA
jgi:uncharacterized small protein (DUF1192 family)